MCCPCCINTLNLGCFNPCGLVFDAGVVGVGDAGDWSLRVDFGRSFLIFDNTFVEGQPIRFKLSNINELYTYTATITKPDGSLFTLTVGDIVYDCFKFSTKLNGASEISLI
jgi:hypothetical protein